MDFLSDLPDNSVDLILTDPPYITSRESGMNKWVGHVAKQDAQGSADIMTETDWLNYKTEEQWDTWFSRSSVKEPKREDAIKRMTY